MDTGYWLIQHGSDILSSSSHRMAKRRELMRNPSLPKGLKVCPLIPCNYLATYVVDGRCKRKCKCESKCYCNYLDTFVLDGRDGQTYSYYNNINYERLNWLLVSICSYMFLLTVVLFSVRLSYQFCCTDKSIDIFENFALNFGYILWCMKKKGYGIKTIINCYH